ncbi:MAG: acyltransferase, partial [Candidatus Gastranaerophilales bacterium]|nr:acyltransferase [Candidatus Gastranaerophilales bacterium]
MEESDKEAQALGNRLYYLDWLKVFAILMVFIFHNTHFFDFIDWCVKNNAKSPVMMGIFLSIHFWSMPLFFLLAGAGAKFALDSRTSFQYVLERLKRLILPLIIGMLILAPPQGYVEDISKFRFRGSFCDYYPVFFRDLFDSFSMDAYGENTYHLWFLGFLFCFSVVALPLFLWFKSDFAKRIIDKVAGFCENKGAIFLFALPILMSHLLIRVSYPEYSGWGDFSYWLIYFIYGYVIFSNSKFDAIIKKHGKQAFVLSLLCLSLLGVMFCSIQNVVWFRYPDYSFMSVVFMLLYSILTWSWVIFILSLGSKLLNFSNRFLKYSSEALLPFYLLHQTVILLIGFFVVRWNMGIWGKFFIISAISLVVTAGIYDFFIRRNNLVRVLFG